MKQQPLTKKQSDAKDSDNPITAVTYIRVCTDEQALKDYSQRNQEERCVSLGCKAYSMLKDAPTENNLKMNSLAYMASFIVPSFLKNCWPADSSIMSIKKEAKYLF